MSILIKAGADVNTINDEGQTIIDFIGYWEDEALVEMVYQKFDFEAVEARKRALEAKRHAIRKVLGVEEGSVEGFEKLKIDKGKDGADNGNGDDPPPAYGNEDDEVVCY